MDGRVGLGQLPEAEDPANAPGEGASGGLTGQFASSSPCIPSIVKLLEDRRALSHRLRERARVRGCAERSGSSYRCSVTLVSSPSRLQLPRAAANSGPVRLPVGARFGMTSSIVSSRCNSRPSQRSRSRRPYSSVLQGAHASWSGGPWEPCRPPPSSPDMVLARLLCAPAAGSSTCLATHAGKTSATTARRAVIERTPPCREAPAPVGRHLPITPVLGSGNHNLGWGIVAPSAISNDGDGTSWVACINWSGWGDVQSYGTGWAEIYGPQNTRPIVGVELEPQSWDGAARPTARPTSARI